MPHMQEESWTYRLDSSNYADIHKAHCYKIILSIFAFPYEWNWRR